MRWRRMMWGGVGKGKWGGSKKWGCGTSKSQKEELLKREGAGMSNVEQGEAGRRLVALGDEATRG